MQEGITKDKPDIKLVRALQDDFKTLYVKEFTTGWRASRFIRNIELGLMQLKNTKRYIFKLEQEAYERGVQDGMKEKVYDKKGKSSCCGADVYVGGKGPTLWYVCDKCGNPCDWVLKAKK